MSLITDKFAKSTPDASTSLSGDHTAGTTTLMFEQPISLPTTTPSWVTMLVTDAVGNVTSYESVKGIYVASSNSLTLCVRGAEGTNQDWPANTKVFAAVTAGANNDFVDGILVQHNQDGTHKLPAGSLPTASLSSDAGILAAMLGNGAVSYAKLLSTIFSGQIQSYTPSTSGVAGVTIDSVTGKYLNLGGIKLCWGTVTLSYASSSSGHVTVSLPSGFFSGVDSFLPGIMDEVGYAYQTASGGGVQLTSGVPSGLGIYVNNGGATGAATVTWLTIGS